MRGPKVQTQENVDKQLTHAIAQLSVSGVALLVTTNL